MELEIIIPETWNDITLAQYTDFKKTVKPFEGHDEFASKIIEHAVYRFCGVDVDVFHKLPSNIFLTVQQSVLNLMASPKNEVLIKSFEIGDKKYGFIPDLNEMTYGEYVDLVHLSKETWENIAEIMAILYRPITNTSGKTYQIQPYTTSSEDQISLIRNKITMDIVFGALSFFLLLQKDLLKGTLIYSMAKLKTLTPTQKKQINQLFLENGVSTQQFQSLLEMTLQSLTP